MSLAFLCRFNCGHGKLCHRLNVQTSSNCLTDILTSHMDRYSVAYTGEAANGAICQEASSKSFLQIGLYP